VGTFVHTESLISGLPDFSWIIETSAGYHNFYVHNRWYILRQNRYYFFHFFWRKDLQNSDTDTKGSYFEVARQKLCGELHAIRGNF
jgi:hypothetical protein